MKNRAKCRVCNDILENVKNLETVTCRCGEISLDTSPDGLHAHIKSDKNNLIFVDDEGNLIVPGTIEKESAKPPTKEELLDILDSMVENIRSLPPQAMHAPVNHSDFCSLLLFLSAFFRSD